MDKKYKTIFFLGLFFIFTLLLVKIYVTYSPKELSSKALSSTSSFAQKRAQWSKWINDKGAKTAYKDFLNQNSNDQVGSQHLMAHAFGSLLYDKAGQGGIAICDSSFNYGCYHGFFSQVLEKNDPKIVKDLEQVCDQKLGRLSSPCKHGIGHGLLEFFGHDPKGLNKALKYCETTPIDATGQRYFGCFTGVFMEYDFPLTITSETAYISTRPFDKTNPTDPCTKISSKYRSACYHEMTQWWLDALSNDYKKIGEMCDVIESNFTQDCFRGIGNFIPGQSNNNISLIIKNCDLMPDENSDLLCRLGAGGIFSGSKELALKADSLCDGLAMSERGQCLAQISYVKNINFN